MCVPTKQKTERKPNIYVKKRLCFLSAFFQVGVFAFSSFSVGRVYDRTQTGREVEATHTINQSINHRSVRHTMRNACIHTVPDGNVGTVCCGIYIF